jgi:thiol-disulfide isomerase/thioredoxin
VPRPADIGRLVRLALLLGSAVAAAETSAQAPLAGLPVSTLEGKQTRMDVYLSRVTVVALWAHWCKPCIAELPMLDALYRKHQGDGAVAVVAVNVDAPEAQERARATAAGLNLSLPVLLDSAGQVRRRVNALMGRAETAPLSLPLTLLLDPEGHASGERGLQMGISEAEFVAAKERLIERALRGGVPAGIPTEFRMAALAEKVQLSSPRLAEEEIARRRPTVRQTLVRTFPSASADAVGEMLRVAEETMRSGGSVEISPPR